MRILFLGYENSPLVEYIRTLGDEVVVTNDRIDADYVKNGGIEFIVSYGYRHMIKPDVLAVLPDKVINLHIALLPWNRGADPNFWSFAENTPKGVTIHHVDAGLDTGDIIIQKEIVFPKKETLGSSYQKLQGEIQNLFQESWPDIRLGNCHRKPQPRGGTYHKVIDKESLFKLLPHGWDTSVSNVQNIFLKNKPD